MRAKKFTKKIKVSLDEETYKQAKELADTLTYGNVSELIRQLIKIAYNNEKGERA
jgi:Arc/MetJ-type ribon-helix-helix transcriptional regulator